MKEVLNIKLTTITGLTMLLFFCFGCKEDIGITINKVGEKPGQVSNVQVTPISGGAILKYNLPLSEDLRYVVATYSLDNGIKRETKASIYKNELIVDGFGKEGNYEIELRSVAVGEVSSDPLKVQAAVLRPPHQLVLDKMQENNDIVATFGGLNLSYSNETLANLIIRVIRKDSVGEWIPVESEYTNFKNGTIRVRGQKAKATDFGVYVEDRWDHTSDTLIVNLTPIEEVAIPTTKWARFALPGDAGVRSSGFPFNGIWDGNTNAGYLSVANANTNESISLPNSLTLDLGIPVIISRMQIWATRYSNISDVYGPAHIYDFEIFSKLQDKIFANRTLLLGVCYVAFHLLFG